MPVIGVLTLEIHVEDSHSLKEKRHVVKSLKDRLRVRFNVSVAEVEGHAAELLGGALQSSGVEWL